MESLFKEEGYIYCGKERVGKRIKYKFLCPAGHFGSVRKDHWNRGVRCAKCKGNAKLTIDEVRSDIEKEGYKLLTTTYINSAQILETVCPKGHMYKMSRNNWTQGYRCVRCSGRMSPDMVDIKQSVNDAGYSLLSNNYKNNKQKLMLMCKNGHEYAVSWDNWKNKNSRCPKCNEVGRSIQEKILYNFVVDLCNDSYQNDRVIIAPYELDIVIPSKKIAIEYCGLYWHSENMGKDRNYHIKKQTMCSAAGYRLLTIFEDELVSNEHIVFSRLRSILNSNSLVKVYGRMCSVEEINTNAARDFCNTNHLQGYGYGASIRVGAFFNGDLIGVMTFSKPSLSKGYKNSPIGVWELSRFCTKIGYRVIGLSSKLLKYFVRNYDFCSIFSYADCRWSIGNMYEQIGFSFMYDTKPNYWYFKNNKNRIHRFALRKKKDEPKDITEWELRRSQGYNRIWDCGNKKYILDKERVVVN